MIDKDLLSILACPETKKDLTVVEDSVIERLNAAIEAGKVRNKAQQRVTEVVSGGLYREGDQSCMYPVRQNIPILLVDELILLDCIQD